MALHFQLDVPDDVPRFGRTHLTVFQCPVHNEACVPCVDLHGAEPPSLPPDYMAEPPRQLARRFWRVYLFRGAGVLLDGLDPFVASVRLTKSPCDDDEAPPRFLKVGGEPAWLQDKERYLCACGAPMAFVAQVNSDVGFGKLPDAPVQPDTFDDSLYLLFLGNSTYFLACTALCDPRAVWPVNQN